MTMQGIDISSYQAGIDLTRVPCDFIIVKATQGAGYMNPDCVRAVEQALAAGKLVGVYHYIDGSGVGEADFFVDQISGWVDRALVCLDWEPGSNSRWGDLGYLGAVIDRVRERTGRPPVVYASAAAFPWQTCAARGCGTWVAQYADMTQTGYQDHPWNEGSYQCDIRQYSATGRLPGWAGDLDLDIFYGNRTLWDAYVTGAGGAGKESDVQLTDIVIRPDGHEATVQDVLSYIDMRCETLAGQMDDLMGIVKAGGITRRGDGDETGRTDLCWEVGWLPKNFAALQDLISRAAQREDVTALVNELQAARRAADDQARQQAEPGTVAAAALAADVHVVEAGETLKGIAEAAGTTVQAIVDANPGLAPNDLVAGQRITVPTSKEHA
ncbi:GH25 family lysozyme [Propionibacterium acidifaciens]|uniref:GH25 family lysozyme n=1 Tax=Propionibacterium acidifaciens TaxID=556499 RepID=UPI00361D25DA